jgi:putative nucleotidyltransferase with HDIG domain
VSHSSTSVSSQTQFFLERASAEERTGLWDSALRSYEEAFRAAVASRDVGALLETLARKGHCYRQADAREMASECFELVLVLAELRDDASMSGRALNGVASLQQITGDIDAAEQTYLRARDLALRANNDQLIGETEQNLGILANIRGNLRDALQRYLSGLAHMRRAGRARGCVSALNNLGMLHIDLDELDAADQYFAEALQICEAIGDVVQAGAVHINRAELFLARGAPDQARESCDQGFEIFSRLNDEVHKAEALKFYGIIYRQTGKLSLAAIHLREAIEIAARKDPLLEAEAQRELALVMRGQGRNREALEALNRAHSLFRTLRAAPDHADVTDRISQLESDFLSLVRMWGESIEAKDRYTSGHCERVAAYACRIAEEAGMAARDLVWFRMGAFLHDLGKTEVPEEILNKPGRLTDEERAIMERHTVTGDEMLAPVEFPWDIRPIVRSHHERWDGMGYPDRLAGENIPLPARILRVADIFDALTSVRSYRRPLSPEEAFRIMEEDEGSFDPALFEIFRRLLPELSGIALKAAEEAVAGQ